jgi:hypothetical protein
LRHSAFRVPVFFFAILYIYSTNAFLRIDYDYEWGQQRRKGRVRARDATLEEP